MEAGTPPLVDVVLPTYGPVPYLRDALDSVLAQTYPAWRLTLIDNSPETGGARAVLDRYGDDPRLRYQATGGLSQAENWNAAFRSGDAPYIAMIHDDDVWAPEFLERRVAAMEAHPECAFVFSAYREIDSEGRIRAIHAPRVPAGPLPPEQFVPVEFVRNAIPVCSVLYRRSAFAAVGASFDPTAGYIDYDLWLRLAVRYPVYSLHEWDNDSRVHDGSVTTAFQESRRNGELWLRLVDHAEATLAGADRELVPTRLRRRRRSAAILSVAADDLQAGDRKQALAGLRRGLRLYPRAVIDARVPFLLVGLATGRLGGKLIAGARAAKLRWDIPTHDHDVKRRLDDLRLTLRR
jgi:glycosyltransferase involved in cell wall biosynthesis